MSVQTVNGKPDGSSGSESESRVRAKLLEHQVFSVAVRGGAGCGKTSLISATITKLGDSLKCAVICGDPSGDYDAQAYSHFGIPVVQVNTGDEHFLAANLIAEALELIDLTRIDVLFVEDCGNVNLGASDYHLGMHRYAACLSSCQGEFAIKKYTRQFAGSTVNLITKADLAQAVGFSVPQAVSSLKRINPAANVIVTSAREGDGVDAYCDCIRRELAKEVCQS